MFMLQLVYNSQKRQYITTMKRSVLIRKSQKKQSQEIRLLFKVRNIHKLIFD